MPNQNFDVTLEGNIPVVNLNGVQTNKNITSTGTNTWSGTNTFSGSTVFSGARTGVVNGSSGNTSPTTAQSGQTFLFDSATGITYTLPAPTVGLTYDFIVTTTVTSGNHKIITDAGTTLLLGAVLVGSASGTPIMAQGNGSTHVAVTMNGTTTGGLVGTWINFKCVSATKWEVSGSDVTQNGAPATPFATS